MSGPLDIDALEALAKEVGAGCAAPWKVSDEFVAQIDEDGEEARLFECDPAGCMRHESACKLARYVAALHPSVVLALVAEVRALGSECERLRQLLLTYGAKCDQIAKAKAENDERFMGERDEARRERDALKATLDKAHAAVGSLREEAVDFPEGDIRRAGILIAQAIELALGRKP